MINKMLAKLLLENPNNIATISIDISTSEEDFDKRAFSDNIVEVIKNCQENPVRLRWG